MAANIKYLCDIPNLSDAQRLYLHHNQLDPDRIYDMNKSTFTTDTTPKPIIVGEYNKSPVFLGTNGETYSKEIQTPLYPNFMSKNDIHIFTPNKLSNVQFVAEQKTLKQTFEDNQLVGLEFSKQQISSLQKHMLDLEIIMKLNVIPKEIIDKRLALFDPPVPSLYCLD